MEILKRAFLEEIGYLAPSGRQNNSLITADVPASQPMCIHMALSKKGPLYLGSAICPSFFGTGLEGEEWCKDERLQKRWHLKRAEVGPISRIWSTFWFWHTSWVQAFRSTSVPMSTPELLCLLSHLLHRLPRDRGVSSLEISKSHMNTALGPLLWVLERGLGQMDTRGPCQPQPLS